MVAAIAVSMVLLLAGTFTYATFTNRANDTAAKANLTSVALAEAATMNFTGSYTATTSSLTLDGRKTLTVDAGTKLYANGTGCFAAFSPSQSGTWFVISSVNGNPSPVPELWPASPPVNYPTGCTWPAAAPAT